MDREKELVKLVNVLRHTSRMAVQSELTGTDDKGAASFCAETYNRVVAEVVGKLLPVVDNLQRAFDAESSVEAGESSWTQ